MNPLKKSTQLKNLIQSPDLAFLMEAHNGLSAKIVEEAGFKGIWGSGLSISASLGVRDNNEASWTQVLDVAEYMSDATTIPILLDADTGYGNFNNMRRLVKKAEQIQLGGLCIEDKIFPKTNSFLRGEKQPLAQIEEFCGKIKAGLDARQDSDFCIVARVEALIAGHGMEEALKRAHAYREAGAHAILIHSKINKADEIIEFMKQWNCDHPIVIVPTKYYATPTQEFRKHKISTVIWANHLLRSSITAMQKVSAQIFQDESLVHVEKQVASVQEIFRLQNDQELEEAEKKYFQNAEQIQKECNSHVIFLAAGQGEDVAELTHDRPKALLQVHGTPIIQVAMEQFKKIGLDSTSMTIVSGYKSETFPKWDVNFINNVHYKNSSELTSLHLAFENRQGQTYICYGDVVFRHHVIHLLNDALDEAKKLSDGPHIAIVVDTKMEDRAPTYKGDFITASGSLNSLRPQEFLGMFQPTNHVVLQAATTTKEQSPHMKMDGEWIGLLGMDDEGTKKVQSILNELSKQDNFHQLTMIDLFNKLINQDVKISIASIQGEWMDVDSYLDFEKVQHFSVT